MIDYGYCQSEIAVGDSFITEPDIRKVLAGIKAIGGSRVRFLAAWDLIQPPSAPGTFNWVEMDRAMSLCKEYGIRPLPCIGLGYGKGGDGSAVAFGNTCRAIAERYGPAGTNQLYEMEMLNEENASINFSPNSAAEYTKLLKAAYPAIKSVHSSCTVIVGGPLQTTDVPFLPIPVPYPPFVIFASAINPLSWIKGIYDAGGKDYFDAIGFHYYPEVPPTSDGDWQWKYLTDIRALMVAQGDGVKKIWTTEVGVSFPGFGTLVQCRDQLKANMEALESQTFTGPIFIYSYRNASRNVDGNSVFGMVDYDFVPKSPLFEYAQTIAGTPSDPGDIIPPSAPVLASPPRSDVTSTSAKLLWTANPDIDGVTNYRVYSDDGVKVAQTEGLFVTVNDLQPATTFNYYITAVDAAGNESAHSDLIPVTTDAPSGLQQFFRYKFTGSGTPTIFTQLGLGFSVSGGVALHNAPTADGRYYTVAPYGLDMQSPDHSSRISLAGRADGSDRAAMALVRMSTDGTSWVGVLSCGGGNTDSRPNADSLKIITCVAGVVRVRNAKSVATATASQDVELAVLGNAYTARIIDVVAAETIAELPWTDTAYAFPGSANRRAGMGWQHLRVGAVNYPAPGITQLKAADLFAVASGGAADLWTLAVTDEDDWAQIIATGIYETAL